MSKEERIQEIRERLSKATKGPWFVQFGMNVMGPHPAGGKPTSILTNSNLPLEEREANHEFIANAREDIPFLLSELSEPQAVPETNFPEAKELLIQKALRGLPKQVGNYPVEIKIRVLADEIVRLLIHSPVPDTKGLEK